MEIQRADALCSLLLLQARGLPVSTVIDVGAAEGSFFLLRHDAGLYPNARHLFVDVMHENEPLYQRLATRFPVSHAICAAANLEGEIDIRVDPAVYNTHVRGLQDGVAEYAPRRVPARTLDSIADGLPAPYLVKIDVQGGELDVLRGASKVLRDASIVVLEAQVCLFRDTVADLIQYARGFGLLLYDITNLAYYQSDHTLYQCLITLIAQRHEFRAQQPWTDPALERRHRETLAERRRVNQARLAALCP